MFGLFDGARGFQVIEGNDFGADEASSNVGVNLTGGIEGGAPFGQQPGSDLIAYSGEKGDVPQSAVGFLEEGADGLLAYAHVLSEGLSIGFLELADLHLKLRTDRDRGAGPIILEV